MGILADIGSWITSKFGSGDPLFKNGASQSEEQSPKISPESIDLSSIPSPDDLLSNEKGGYGYIDDLNNRIKDAYIESGGTGYIGPDDYTGQAEEFFENYTPEKKEETPNLDATPEIDPIGDLAKELKRSFFESPKSGDGRYWDENSSDYDPAMAFLGPEVMPRTQRDERAADKAAYDNYMSYYNDRSVNPEEYNDNELYPEDWLSEMLPWSSSGGEYYVDNGTNAYFNRTSNFITGAEAKKQASYFGNDELSEALKNVGDNDIISKSSLKRYGYSPFVDTSSVMGYLNGKLGQGLSTIAEGSEELWNTLSDVRNEKTDWDVNLFDSKFSGKAVDQAIHDARSLGAGAYDEEGNWMPSGIQIDPTMAVQRSDGLWIAPASNGSEYVIDAGKFDNGGYTLRYQDAIVEDSEGNEQRIPMENWGDVTKDYSVAEFLAAVYYPELSLGEKEAKAAEIYEDMGDATYYGPLNVNAPSYKSDNMLSEYALPSFINGVLSSGAYLNPVSLVERTALAAYLSAQGLNTNSQSVGEDGIKTYQPSDNQSLNTLMSVLAPVAESKLGSLGNVGGKGFLERGAEALSSRIPGLGNTWAGKELIPAAVSEGLEEVVTDPLYAIQDSGTGAYANQAFDENGLLAYDEYDRPIYEDTDIAQRIRNYMQDQPNNFVMGAAMGGGINAIPRAARHLTKSGRQEIAAEKADRDFFNQYVRQFDGSFSRDDTISLKRQADAINKLADIISPDDRIQLTMQEFEDMLDNAKIVDGMDGSNALEANVKRNVR